MSFKTTTSIIAAPMTTIRPFRSHAPQGSPENRVDAEILQHHQVEGHDELEKELQEALQHHKQLVNPTTGSSFTDSDAASSIQESLDRLRELYEKLERWEDVLAVASQQVQQAQDALPTTTNESEADAIIRHNRVIAKSLDRMGYGYYRLNRGGESLDHYQQALAVWTTRVYPPKHFSKDIGSTLNGLAGVRIQFHEDFGEAMQLLKQAEEHYRHDGKSIRDLVQAEEDVAAANAVVEASNRPPLIKVLLNQAMLLRIQNDHGGALVLYNSVLALIDQQQQQQQQDDTVQDDTEEEQQQQLTDVQLDIADCYMAMGDVEQAQTLFEELLDREADPRSSVASVVHHNLGMIFAKRVSCFGGCCCLFLSLLCCFQPTHIFGTQDLLDKAIESLVLSKEIKTEHVGPTHPEVGKTCNALGAIYAVASTSEDSFRIDDPERLHQQALASFREALLIARIHTTHARDEEDPEIQHILRNISLLQQQQQQGGGGGGNFGSLPS